MQIKYLNYQKYLHNIKKSHTYARYVTCDVKLKKDRLRDNACSLPIVPNFVRFSCGSLVAAALLSSGVFFLEKNVSIEVILRLMICRKFPTQFSLNKSKFREAMSSLRWYVCMKWETVNTLPCF